MTKNELLAKLHVAGFEVRSEVRVQSHDRWRFMLGNGAIVDCLDDGGWTVWGHGQEGVRSALGPQGENSTPIVGSPLIAGDMSVTADQAAGRILLELSGRIDSGASPISISFLIRESFARELSARLSAGAYQLRQAPRKAAPKAKIAANGVVLTNFPR